MTTTSTPAEWKNYDDFAAGIATNRAPSSAKLSGESFEIRLNTGRQFILAFQTAQTVQVSEGRHTELNWCDVVEVAPDTFFIDMTFAAKPDFAETLILNVKTRRVLSIVAEVRNEGTHSGEPRVAQTYQPGVILGGGVSGMEPAPTRDLIGLTAHYTYSPNHVYEHIYLSAQRYAWQCLKGVQRGHGDVDLATTFKFADGQYVFGFREFIIPVASLFFYNWQDMRSTGKFLGVTGEGKIMNSPAGAFISKNSTTTYPAGLEPV